MFARIAFVLLFGTGTAVAQQYVPLQQMPTGLIATSSEILETPGFSAMGAPLCDDKGEVFFHVPLRSNSFTDSSVMEISPKSSDPVVFRLSNDLASKYVFGFFSVTPSGKVWFLDANVEDPSKEAILYVFGFDSDGTMSSNVKLDVPEHLSADDFAVSQTGVIFLAAHFSKGAPKPLQGKRFQGLFEKSGKLRTMLTPEDSQDVDMNAISSMNGGTINLGMDGNFYFLRPGKIVVISETGEAIRTIPFKKPAPDLSAAALRLSQGFASVEFQRVGDDGSIRSEFLVLDAATGDTFGFYLPPEHVGMPLCFSRNSGFTFLAKEGTKNKIVTAPMR